MNPLIFVLILFSVSMSAAAQILLKFGMSATPVKVAMTNGGVPAVMAILSNLYVWGGLAMYGLSMVLWLAVLSKIDVSQAYPFVGLGFILTMVFGIILLGEPFSIVRALGTVLVLLGVLLVARSG